MKIRLKPLGDVADEIMEEVRDRVRVIFHCPIEMEAGFSDLAQAYSPERKQYYSSKLLASLKKSEREERVVGVADVDLYVPRLNFVFGEADILSGTAIVSLWRLRQEYYGLAPDKALFLERATKEVVHELGHTFGLEHCPNNKCVMHFSNSLADTDLKEAHFCSACRPKIIL
ncbi:MAG: archaemetzincin family Zn-dependent metalloprotease [Dehalococcoidia bacterium]|nr:archaemetzincin family Zn-dependent metalloprotease [Dehalococcoidia bacterium]MDH4299287.1 archaemetzincin family Zn-dependent metalloprotease [Dehalococcoidia bacterium]MDH4366742.1 archaemetzincin family Zn-dependent metalloprotease [Dehalococcoidia bacterium]